MKSSAYRFLTGLSLFAFITTAPSAFAVQSINVQTYNPSTSDHFVLLEDGFMSEWPKKTNYYFGANWNYVSEPFVATDATESVRLYNIIDSIQTFDLMFGFKVSPKLGLFFGLPIHFIQYPDAPPATGLASGSSSGIGDLKLLGKIRFTDDTEPFSVALIPEFHLPTGSTENFVSDASTYLAARLAIERVFNNFTLVGNLGYANANNSIYQSAQMSRWIDYRKRFIFGLGGFMPINDQWGANVEFSSIHMLPFDASINPNELYGGLRYASNENMIFTFGASVGKIGGATGQTFRVIAGIRYNILDDETVQAPYQPTSQPISQPAPLATPEPMAYGTPKPLPVVKMRPKQAILQSKRIELLTPIMFENNSAKLRYESQAVLNDVAEILRENRNAYRKIIIDGHTNNIGSDAYNLKLSLARSKSVKSYLVSQGISSQVLEARGFGERTPKVSYRDPRAMEINRRVEFIVVK